MTPRMLMRKQLREDPSGYNNTEEQDQELKSPTAPDPEPLPTLHANHVSKTQFYKLQVEIIQFQVRTRYSIYMRLKNARIPDNIPCRNSSVIWNRFLTRPAKPPKTIGDPEFLCDLPKKQIKIF